MILDEIATKTKERIEILKREKPLSEIKREALQMEVEMKYEEKFRMEEALGGDMLSFICEIKKASPSKGEIVADFPYLKIAQEYEAAGASAISVLTEPYYFKGSNQYLKEIVATVKIPVLRKDFTVDEYMIYEAKTLGASAVLLICSILSQEQLKEYMELANDLHLSALVEAHDEREVERALATGARIIGVNNRDLKTFTVDIENSIRLRELVPEHVIYISESGIKTNENIKRLKQYHVNGVLIGETLMRSNQKKEILNQYRMA